ncbi:hypothetical protein [Bacillus paralicheniformis]|uniref:hypothetical protein n=1 Tax=Bacillus paralicheniformis TaxID=1648923 RepID=UPI0009496FA7|nr:hypothetical protein [Bacillus paralicheniformis]
MVINWISSRNEESYITLDSQQRIYISARAREIIGLPKNAPFLLTIGYDLDENRIIVAKPENVKTDSAPFKFDKRSYNKSARKVLGAAGFSKKDLPLRFFMIGDGDASKQPYLAYPKGTYAFQLDE